MQTYFQILKNHLKLIIFVALLGGIFSFILVKIYPTTYTASTLLSVNRVNKAENKDFQFDNYYYSIQATEAVGNTVTGMMQSPEIILEIYKKAGMENEIKDISADTKKFRPKQISSHLIKLKVTTPSASSSEKLVNAAGEVLKNRVRALETTFDKKNSFDVSAEKPIVFINKYSPAMVTILGLICGLFLGAGLAFLFEYFKEEKNKI